VQVSTALTVECTSSAGACLLTVDRTSVHAAPRHSLPAAAAGLARPSSRVTSRRCTGPLRTSRSSADVRRAPQLPVLVSTLTQALLQQLGVAPAATPAPISCARPVPQPQRPPAHASPPQRTCSHAVVDVVHQLTHALPQQLGVPPVRCAAAEARAHGRRRRCRPRRAAALPHAPIARGRDGALTAVAAHRVAVAQPASQAE
jgi:hypothetical protein